LAKAKLSFFSKRGPQRTALRTPFIKNNVFPADFECIYKEYRIWGYLSGVNGLILGGWGSTEMIPVFLLPTCA
jgi:hypothetical protein